MPSRDSPAGFVGRIGGVVIFVFAVASRMTGIILSVTTPWKLIHYWWLVAQLVLDWADLRCSILIA